MNSSGIEIEAKFAVVGLDPMRQALHTFGARRIGPPLPESNLRFDSPDARLQQSGCVLRLRRNHESRLTFKAPGDSPEHRVELEIGVDRPEVAQQLLVALGFAIFFVYEKIRETYALDGTEVMLDELPFGRFVEIEGEDVLSIRRTAERLGLTWAERLPISYLGIFDRLRRRHDWTFRDATFANFREIAPVSVDELRAAAAGR